MPGTPGELLERSQHVSALSESLAAVAASSRGHVVLVGGEAGVGKTTLLRRFSDQHRRSTRILWGACDALFTPRPLGPLLDVARSTHGELRQLVDSGARPYDVAASLLSELGRESPTILILEDVHWADEATLDVLRLLGRRVEAVPALVLVSYRDDSLGHAHPLRIVLGEMASSPGIGRLKVEALSPAAVATLAEPSGVDADELYRKTGGNSFFVTEVLAAAEDEIPNTIRDAVFARSARLSPAARNLLEAVAIAPPQVELWLLDALAGPAVESLDECLSSGVLTSEPGGVAFRHELARLAVEESLAPNRALALHRAALVALGSPPAGGPDLARVAHHAESARDAQAVLRFAPAAGRRAASLGAHREAAAQFARALRYGESLGPGALADLFEARAYECYLTGQLAEAIEAQSQALDGYRRLGDARKEGDSLRSLARLLRYVGRPDEAAQAGQDAVDILERLPPGRELAMAYSNVSYLCMSVEDAEGTVAWGNRALELAERLDDVEAVVLALNNIGVVDVLAGAPEGMETFKRCLELARGAGLDEHAGRAFVSFVWWAARTRSYDVADRYLEAGLEYCTDRGLDLWRLYLLAHRARSELDRGHWADALESAGLVLGDPRSSPVPRVVALAVVGLVRARRGDQDYWPLLDEALALARPTGELQRIAPMAAARAEVAWLEGDREAVAQATEAALELAVRRRAAWVIGELACWRRRAGITEDVPPGAGGPFALQLAGEHDRATELWTGLGCPYEAALALADTSAPDALRRALDGLQDLGARPVAALVARRLREAGATGLPRGPRRTTRENPANLTSRELEVLALIARGLRNAEIAKRLFLSDKTVDHHVSAILRKLGVPTRSEASAAAARLGLAGQDQ